MPLAVVIRRVFLITLLFLPQQFWLGSGWQLAGGLRRPSWRLIARAFLVIAPVAMVSVLCDRIFRKFLPANLSLWIAPPLQLWIFTSTFTYFFMKIAQVIVWSFRAAARLFRARKGSESYDSSRRSVLRQAASLAACAPFAAAVYGFAWERLRFQVVRVDVSVAGLPDGLDGLRIVQLSDIHVGDFMPLDQVRRAVDIANGLAPHLAVITGDYVTSAGDPLADCISELSRLKAPMGVFGCNGNHEIYAGAEEMAEELFTLHGMKLLRVEALVRRDMTNILLSHDPNTFSSAAAAGVQLSLAGHTHGGQVNVEILNKSWSPARFMTNFVAGLYQLPMAAPAGSSDTAATGPAYLYVNRGLGTLGVPARIGANPEITLITLKAGG